VRHPSSIGLSGAIVALVLAAVAAFALANIHGNAKHLPPPPRVEQRESLGGATAISYNPFGTGGPDNPAQAQLAIDGKLGGGWATNRYVHGVLGKPGVGLYIELASPLAANRLSVATPTPGFAMQVWGAHRISTTRSLAASGLGALGWHRLGQLARVGGSAAVVLRAPATPYRYYLVWITRLEPVATGTRVSARIADLGLWRARPA
jgi:hypothetical protein